MENSKTLKEATEEIASLVREVDWSKDKKQAIAYFVFDEEGVTSNIVGHCDLAASAIATAMAADNDVRDVISGAHHAYVDHMSNKLAPLLGPMIKRVQEASKSLMGSGHTADVPIELFSAEFKRRQS